MSDIALPNFQELYDIAKNEIENKDTLLNDFSEGSVLDVHCGGSAAVGSELVYQLTRILKAFYISTSEGDDLDARLKDYGIVRKESYAANNTITLTRTGSGSSSLLILAGTTFKCSVDGTEFYNENDITFSAGQKVATAIITAKIAGTGGNVLANTIDTISPSPNETIVITHTSFNNGIDGETDAQLRNRFYLEISTMARGTGPALITGALRHDGVSNAAIEKIHSGYTLLYIDSGTGVPPQSLIDEVQEDIDANWKAAGEKVTVLSAETFDIDISGTVIVSSEVTDTQAVLDAIETAIVSFLRQKTMGASVYKSELVKVGMSISGVVDFELTAPTANIPGQASKIVRAGAITIDPA